jgi:hypothetical protein
MARMRAAIRAHAGPRSPRRLFVSLDVGRQLRDFFGDDPVLIYGAEVHVSPLVPEGQIFTTAAKAGYR